MRSDLYVYKTKRGEKGKGGTTQAPLKREGRVKRRPGLRGAPFSHERKQRPGLVFVVVFGAAAAPSCLD